MPWIQSSDLKEDKVCDIKAKKHISVKAIQQSSAKKISKNSIAIVTRVSVGKLVLMPYEYATSQDFLSISVLQVDKWFGVYSLYNKLQSELNSVQGTSIKGITKDELLNKKIMIPKPLKEQSKIGLFLKKIDTTITLHQRKLEQLKELKTAYLQVMFPAKDERVPKLRFAAFEDDWKLCKLGRVVERVTRKNKELKSTLPLTISAQEGLIDQNVFFNKSVASRDVSGYYLIYNGEFAYNKSYSNGYPWGAIKRLNRYDMGVLSTLYIIFKPKNIDSNFLEKYYDTSCWYHEVSKHAAEGARNHGLLNIAASDFLRTELIVPKSVEEQRKIGNFLKQLDDTITLHQNKLTQLKSLKKSYLQNMFI